MALSTATSLSGATISASGGATVQWSSLGLQGNKNVLVVAADTDLRIRRQIDASAKTPSVQLSAPNGYSQARGVVFYKKPKLLANGKVTVNTARVEIAYDVETTPTEIQDLLDVASQVCFDSDFTPVFKQLSLG